MGEVWNGLISVEETPSDDEVITYIDGVKTSIRRRNENLSGTISAFTYPDSFHKTIFTQTRQSGFGLSYRTQNRDSYRIHLIYNIFTTPSNYTYYQELDLEPFRWNFTTRPMNVPGAKKSSHLVISSSVAYSWTLQAVEDVLYGTDSTAARLPSPEEIFEIFEANSILRIIDHGDGSFTAIGPDSVVQMLDDTTFQIDWPSAVYLDAVSYKLSSL